MKGSGAASIALSTAGTTGYVVIDASWNLTVTTTTANSDIMIGMTGAVSIPTGHNVYFDFEVDGVRLGAFSTNGSLAYVQNNFSTFTMITSVAPVTLARELSAGDHEIKLVWRGSGTTVGLYNTSASIPTFWAREI